MESNHLKLSGYNEVNVVRRYKEYVIVSITHKIHKLRRPHTRGPISQVWKGKQGYERNIGQNACVRLNGLATVKNVSNK